MAFSVGSWSYGGASGAASTTTPATVPITVALHDVVIVNMAVDAATASLSCADNLGNTYAQLGTYVTDSGPPQTMAVFACKDVTVAGSCTVTVTSGASNTARNLNYGAISGLDNSAYGQVTQISTVMAAGTDGLVGGSITPAAQPAMVMGIAGNSYNNTMSVGTGYTIVPGVMGAMYGGFYITAETKRITALTAVTPTWTESADIHNAALFSIVWPEPGGGGGIRRSRKFKEMLVSGVM